MASNQDQSRLTRLLVPCVPSAPATVLAHLQAVAVVVPVLLRDVVTALALCALERHVHAAVAGHLPHLMRIARMEGPEYSRRLLSDWLSELPAPGATGEETPARAPIDASIGSEAGYGVARNYSRGPRREQGVPQAVPGRLGR